MATYISVSTLNKYLKMKFEKDPYLEKVYLTGQVSNYRRRSTHQYFSLKDEESVIQATIWASTFKKVGFDLEEGLKVNVIGRVQIYQPSGQYSIIIESIEPDGIGRLAIQFEQLKNKLEKEGLFKREFKKNLPTFPQKVGVITSQSGAVIRDIITTLNRRFPGRRIVLYPTKVQGDGAAQEIASNIRRANQSGELDLLIVGRGGGSIEDLWAFNEEEVVRAIFESQLPVISSVGHETDTTLADYVADQRAATPTAAAELASPVTRLDVMNYLRESQIRLSNASRKEIQARKKNLEMIQNSVVFRQPERLYDAHMQKLDMLKDGLKKEMEKLYLARKNDFSILRNSLNLLDPFAKLQLLKAKNQESQLSLKKSMHYLIEGKKNQLKHLSEGLLYLDVSKILARGFSLIKDSEGQLIKEVSGLNGKDKIEIEFYQGKALVEVKNVKEII